jgi:hypothetical protein
MERFHAIIFIAGRIRPGSFPRVAGFSYNEEHQKYLYGGKPLTLEEFNQAAEIALDSLDRRYSISVRLVDSPEFLASQAKEEEVRLAAEKAAAEKAAASKPQPETKEKPSEPRSK